MKNQTGPKILMAALALQLLALVALPAAVPASAPVDPQLQGELQTLLSVLDQLIMHGPRDTAVFKSYQTVRNQMQAARIMFVVDVKSSNSGLLQSAYFSPNRNGVSWVVVDPVLMKKAKTQPGLVLTLLMNALVMADSFFSDPANFASLYQDPVGGFLFSMDALYVQALFVRDFIKPNYPTLSGFEQFLIDSLAYENMASSAMFILGVDQEIVYGLNSFELDIKAKKLDAASWLGKISNMVKEIDQKLDKAKELNLVPEDAGTADDSEIRNRSRYVAVISGLTMLKYGVSIMTVQMALFDKAAQQKLKPQLDIFNQSLDGLDAKITVLTDPSKGRVMDYRKNLMTKLGL